MINLTIGEKVWQAVVYFILILLSLLCLLPFLYVVAVSVTPESEVLRRGIVIIPETVTFLAYKEVFISHGIGQAYKITLFRTIVGTVLNVFFTVIAAYPLSKKYLPGRSSFLLFIVFTMMFGGGLIPTYLLIRSLGLLDSPWVLIIPQLISAFNLVIIKGFFEQLPAEIEESARVDGASELQSLWRIILPLSLPVLSTVSLFYAVGHWNSYFDAIVYINDSNLMPLQVILRNILLNVATQSADSLANSGAVSTFAVQMAAVVVTTVPILIVYPFMQKHFTKGVLLGSVKG
ncbi:carbohydrate ABC transporter permease [Paenibacillus macquariensis]|uniref:Aldouronate transport system permease protein n=1 Tax=Paenibacillus macquariensis TaxID=948756 RepID=A0ABY1JKX5_9BACL|nr:carbohydrate ABC transporter permease [Paenibacillus macquariensis]MEC0090036.1 carbohydrate ABC transporter permease [Paenibacillus macquariensis]OAB31082.1 ABC transporter permease [Paenibacillus macquariensis subsp. macquariensis]SIQ36511.1 putative aldouronate transport system permease protein [Paenibacillus macquariensis]